jgi:hypothetical protein
MAAGGDDAVADLEISDAGADALDDTRDLRRPARTGRAA